ncbi:hypothetical protein A8F94_15020 [Bacillus sp. FJAT-27225]|uniref:hypothetical protein n=1 Tax=Bacillus sp. FJAT-27225 TaxID=1743144 RepID=UPI00080C30E3|nr:hypothetical protein [Bacillus sp. FJAT-27225]OCA84041.1 hypothetical protein A8F94_15020 [Bacillus sp. FJAT-27225]
MFNALAVEVHLPLRGRYEDGNSLKIDVYPSFIGYEDGNSLKIDVYPSFIGYEDGNSPKKAVYPSFIRFVEDISCKNFKQSLHEYRY